MNAFSPLRSAALLACTAVLGSVAFGALPPLNSPSGAASVPGKVEWVDLFTGNVRSAAKFYTNLFGWKATSEGKPYSYDDKSGNRRHYVILERDGVPIAGIVQRAESEDSRPGRWVAYLAVTNIDASSSAVRSAGGRVVADPRDVPDRGRQAIAVDPEGAVFGLLQSSSGDIADHRPGTGEWSWFEVMSKSPKADADFYQSVLHCEARPDDRSGQPNHFLLRASGRDRASIGPLPEDGAQADWMGLIRVEDIDAVTAKATSLGGTVLVNAQAATLGSRFAILDDPTGGVFGVVEFGPEATTTATSSSP